MDYRSEEFDHVLAERVTWESDAPAQQLAGVQIAGPGFVWFRFWLTEENQVVEKYFDPQGQPIGVLAPICTPLSKTESGLLATRLHLALWMENSGRLLVLGEAGFEAAVAQGIMDPEEAVWAESQIRTLTIGVTQSRFPPSLVRNLTLANPTSAPEENGGDPS